MCLTTKPPFETIYHACKRRVFPRQSTAWFTPAVRHVSRGLKKSQNKSFRFSNFIRIQLLVRLVDHESPSREFAKAAFLSPPFSFRVPSETLQLRLAYSTDDLAAFSPKPGKSLISARTIEGESFLVVKLPRRKNFPAGCILRRPCFAG